MKEINIEIGKIIRQRREDMGLTQMDLAKILGYKSVQFVSLFERGLSAVPYSVLGKLCKELRLPKAVLTAKIVNDFKTRVVSEMEKAS